MINLVRKVKINFIIKYLKINRCIAPIFVLLFNSCSILEIHQISGETMGTTYNIKIFDNFNYSDIDRLTKKIDSVLEKVNNQFSTYIPDSEINQINNLDISQYEKIKYKLFIEPSELYYDFYEYKHDLNYNCNDVKINKNGVLENFTFSNSADYFKNEINCILNEQYSSAFVNGVLLNTDEIALAFFSPTNRMPRA